VRGKTCENDYLGRLCTKIDKVLVVKFSDITPLLSLTTQLNILSLIAIPISTLKTNVSGRKKRKGGKQC